MEKQTPFHESIKPEADGEMVKREYYHDFVPRTEFPEDVRVYWQKSPTGEDETVVARGGKFKIIGETVNESGPLVTRSTCYHGFIDKSYFPEYAYVYWQEGGTGYETVVVIEAVKPVHVVTVTETKPTPVLETETNEPMPQAAK